MLENHELPIGAEFRDLDRVRGFVHFVVGSAMWRNNPALPQFIKVFSRGDEDYSEAREPNEIWLATEHWNAQVVLHELAHFYDPLVKGHHPRFVNAYLNLVSQFMGMEFFNRYMAAFKREGIRCG